MSLELPKCPKRLDLQCKHNCGYPQEGKKSQFYAGPDTSYMCPYLQQNKPENLYLRRRLAAIHEPEDLETVCMEIVWEKEKAVMGLELVKQLNQALCANDADGFDLTEKNGRKAYDVFVEVANENNWSSCDDCED